MGVRAILAALPILLKERMERKAYQCYIADAISSVAYNTTLHVIPGVNEPVKIGTYLKKNWFDIVNNTPEDTKTGGEIVAEVIKNAGLKVVSD